jgi:2-dehydrotetronate isomerase
MPKFSANLGFLWPDRPLLERIAAAGAAGFKAVELHWPYDTPAAEVKAACAKAGVKLLGINTSPGDAAKGERGLGAVAGREKEFQAFVDQSVAWAREAGATAIHCMAGNVPPAEAAKGAETFVKNLREASEKAPELTLLLEGLNPRDAPGYFYHTIARKAEIIEMTGKPNVKIMFDVYHVGVSEGDVLTKLCKFMPLIGHVQIAAVPSRAEPDEGEINYPAIYAELDALKYDGWVGAEYKPRGTTDAGLGWMKAAG